MTGTTWGRPPKYPFGEMQIGDIFTLDAPTPADVKRICSNASQYGLRHDRSYKCRLRRGTRAMDIERIR